MTLVTMMTFPLIEGTADADLINASGASEMIYSFGGADTVLGGAGEDTIYGDNGKDVLRGRVGADELNGGRGADLLFGGAGFDRIYVSGLDVATGGGGGDIFVFLDYDDFSKDSDAGLATIRDFETEGKEQDYIDLSSFGTTWEARDKGLEDGFEMVRSGDDTILRLKGSAGTIMTLVLEDIRPADVTEDQFFFFR